MTSFAKSQFQTLFNFHWQTTFKLIEHASRLTADEYHQSPGYGHGSIHDLLFHVLRTDWGWRHGVQHGTQPAPLPAEAYPTLDSVRGGFERERGDWQSYLSALSGDDIAAEATLVSRRGDSFTFRRWRVLQHVVFHGMQHHTEIAQLLTGKGQSPGDIDFIFFDDRP